MEDAVLECGGADLGVVSQQQTRELAQETIDDYETHCPTSKPGIGSRTSMETSSTPRNEKLQGQTARWTTSLVLETWSERSQEINKRLLTLGRGHQQHVGHSCDSLPRFLSHSVHDPRYDRLLKTTKQPTNTLRNI